jgi:hypothetical protein
VSVRAVGLAQGAIDRRQRKVRVYRQPPFLKGERIIQHENFRARLNGLHRRLRQAIQALGEALLGRLRD